MGHGTWAQVLTTGTSTGSIIRVSAKTLGAYIGYVREAQATDYPKKDSHSV
jgi:hypothetical protein